MKKTTILIAVAIRERLKKYGIKGDSYDIILTKLMDAFDRRGKK